MRIQCFPPSICFLIVLLHFCDGAWAFSGTSPLHVAAANAGKPTNREQATQGPVSNRVVHVGNLDWMIPSNDIASMLLHAVLGSTTSDVKDHNVNVTVKEVPHPKRKRDEGKFHGGSATIAFGTPQDAMAGMESLQNFSDSRGKELRVRWASMPKQAEETKNRLSEDRIQFRKIRAESYARRRQRVAEKTDGIIQLLTLKLGLDVDQVSVLDAPRLDWSQCPEAIDPMRGGGLRKGTTRGERKQAAVEAFLLVVRDALVDGSGDKERQRFVADLGCGAGNLSLPLSWWLQREKYGVVGVDINGVALDRLTKRASSAGIAIETLQQDLLCLISKPTEGAEDFQGNVKLSDCSAVVSLHACGAASDLSMAAAIAHSLPFAISPCCIGKVNTSRLPGRMPSLTSGERSAAPLEITYPRSKWLKGVVGVDDYQMLAAAADYGVGSSLQEEDAQELARRKRCRIAKHIVEMDRLKWAKEQGYYVRMMELPRIGQLYPKREILLGAKKESNAAARISQLATLLWGQDSYF